MDNRADDGDAMKLSMVRDTKDTDQFVYHYTTRDKALEFILHEFKIKLGLFSKMNDPREAKDWLPSLQGSIPNDLNFRQLVTWAGHNLKNTCKVLCLTRDAPNSIVNDDILSRGFARSRMWAQYADNHYGVCLVLDKQKLGDAIEKELGQKGVIFHQPVEYTNNFREMAFALRLNYQDITSRGLEPYLDEHVNQHHKALFFHKNTDWESEWEYRWVLRGKNDMDEYVSIKNALIGVFLGVNFPYAYMPLVARLNIPFERIRWGYGLPSFECPRM